MDLIGDARAPYREGGPNRDQLYGLDWTAELRGAGRWLVRDAPRAEVGPTPNSGHPLRLWEKRGCMNPMPTWWRDTCITAQRGSGVFRMGPGRLIEVADRLLASLGFLSGLGPRRRRFHVAASGVLHGHLPAQAGPFVELAQDQ